MDGSVLSGDADFFPPNEVRMGSSAKKKKEKKKDFQVSDPHAIPGYWTMLTWA